MINNVSTRPSQDYPVTKSQNITSHNTLVSQGDKELNTNTQEITDFDVLSSFRRDPSTPPPSLAAISSSNPTLKPLNHKDQLYNMPSENIDSNASQSIAPSATEEPLMSHSREEQSSFGRFIQSHTPSKSDQQQPYPQKLNSSFKHSLHESSLDSELYAQHQKRQREYHRAAHIHAATATNSTASSTTGKRPRKKPVSPDMAEQILTKMSETARLSKKHVIDDELFREFVEVWVNVHNSHGIDPGGEGNFKHWFKNQKKFFRIIDESKRKGDCTFDPDSGIVSFASDEDCKEFVEKYKHLVSDIGEKIKKPYKVYSLIKEVDMKRLSSKQPTMTDGVQLDSVSEHSAPTLGPYLKAHQLNTIITHDPSETSQNAKHLETITTTNQPDGGKNIRRSESADHIDTFSHNDSHENHKSSLAPSCASTPGLERGYANSSVNSDQISFIQAVDEMDGFTKDEKARFLSPYLPLNTDILFQPVRPSNINDIKRMMKYSIYCMKKNYINTNVTS